AAEADDAGPVHIRFGPGQGPHQGDQFAAVIAHLLPRMRLDEHIHAGGGALGLVRGHGAKVGRWSLIPMRPVRHLRQHAPCGPTTFALHTAETPCATLPFPPPLTASTAPASVNTWRRAAWPCSTATTSCPPARTAPCPSSRPRTSSTSRAST